MSKPGQADGGDSKGCNDRSERPGGKAPAAEGEPANEGMRKEGG